MCEGGLWANPGQQDNPSNPGTKRMNPKDPYNHRFGSSGGTVVGMATPQNQPKTMKKK